jgi:hypothetical protein
VLCEMDAVEMSEIDEKSASFFGGVSHFCQVVELTYLKIL